MRNQLWRLFLDYMLNEMKWQNWLWYKINRKHASQHLSISSSVNSKIKSNPRVVSIFKIVVCVLAWNRLTVSCDVLSICKRCALVHKHTALRERRLLYYHLLDEIIQSNQVASQRNILNHGKTCEMKSLSWAESPWSSGQHSISIQRR